MNKKLKSPIVIRSSDQKNARVANKLGEQVSHDFKFNCTTCIRWTMCKDINKSYKYRCTRYNEAVDGKLGIEELFESEESRLIKTSEIDYTVEDDGDSAEKALEEIINKAIESNSPIPPDVRLNDHEIPLAKNFKEWLTDTRFLGGGMPPFARQLYVGSLLFGDACPRCSDMDWFDTMKVDTSVSRIEEKIVFLENGKCPKCKGRRSKFIANGEMEDPNTLCLIVGQRGTKTSTVLLGDSYNLHRYLKSPSPTKLYNVQPQQLLMSTYVATTFQQVRENVWDPYMNIITSSPWYSNYNKFLVNRGNELGEELAVISETFIRYRHRNYLVAPASPSKRVLRGRTRFSAFIDEISWLPMSTASGKESERGNAKETYTALRNSLRTLFSAYNRRMEDGYDDIPKPIMVVASSPSTINDMGMTLYRASKTERTILGFKYPTWKFNPLLKRKDFDAEFNVSPVEAARDYGCKPPIGKSTWMTDVASVDIAFNGGPNAYSVITAKSKSATGKKRTVASLEKKSKKNYPYGFILSLDVGIVNNSLAFAISTVDPDFDVYSYIIKYGEKDEDSDEPEVEHDDVPTTVPLKTIFVGEIIPHAETPISLSHFYKNVLKPICEDYDIKAVVSDRWQHLKLVQDLEADFSIPYYEHKLVWEDFTALRDAFFESELSLPKLTTPIEEVIAVTLDNYPEIFRGKPIEHLAYQILTVQEAKGNTVIKGDATDDMFRCIALAHSLIQDAEILKDLVDVDPEETHTPKAALAVNVSMGNLRSNYNVTSGVKGVSSHTPTGMSSAIAAVKRGRY